MYLCHREEFKRYFVEKKAGVAISYTWTTTFAKLLKKLEDFEAKTIAGGELTYFLDILALGESCKQKTDELTV